jgi:hypothetical protein
MELELIDDCIAELQIAKQSTVKERRIKAGLLNLQELRIKCHCTFEFLDNYEPTEKVLGSSKLFFHPNMIKKIIKDYSDSKKGKNTRVIFVKKQRQEAGFHSISELGEEFNADRTVVDHHIKLGHVQPPKHRYNNYLYYDDVDFAKAKKDYAIHLDKIHGDNWFSIYDVGKKVNYMDVRYYIRNKVIPAPTHKVEHLRGTFYTKKEFEKTCSMFEKYLKKEKRCN